MTPLNHQQKQGVNVICNTLDVVNDRYYINFDKLEVQIKENKPKLMMFVHHIIHLEGYGQLKK